MDPFAHLALACAAFLAAHLVSSTPLRGALVRSLGDWQRFAAVTSHIPFVAIAQGRNRLVLAEIGWAKPAIGLALYALVFWAHPWLFGARPY